MRNMARPVEPLQRDLDPIRPRFRCVKLDVGGGDEGVGGGVEVQTGRGGEGGGVEVVGEASEDVGTTKKAAREEERGEMNAVRSISFERKAQEEGNAHVVQLQRAEHNGEETLRDEAQKGILHPGCESSQREAEPTGP